MESPNVKVQNIFHGSNNITCSTNCKYRIACNTRYLRNMVCFGYTIVNTPHKNILELNNVPTYCALLGYYERVVIISKPEENSSQLIHGGCLKTHIYTLLSHLRGRSGHQNFQKYLQYIVITKNILRVGQKAVLLQTCHTEHKFLGHAP